VLGDEEFLSADSSDHRSSIADAPQSVGHSHQDAVPGGVTVGVINVLEIIEIEHQDTETQRARLRSEQLATRPMINSGPFSATAAA
jgi:hypothetical protein